MDFRLESTIHHHPKYLNFERWLESQGRKYQGIYWLTKLYAFAAEYRQSGVLTGMDVQGIEVVVGWDGEPGELVAAFLKVRFLDRDDSGAYALHNWILRQPWIIGAPARSAAARVANEVRWAHKQKANGSESHARNGSASRSKRSHIYSETFEAFWKLYPRPDGKLPASEEWEKLSADEQARAMQDVPKRIHANWAGRDSDKIPHASTYLHQKRFNDGLMAVSTNGTSSTAVRPMKDLGAEVRRTIGGPA
jgi:hypothetical protein